jgi:hypothetical protein
LRKARNSKLALLLVLAMLATLFVGIPAAQAATTYQMLTTPTLTAGDTGQMSGQIHIRFDPLTTTSSAIISLPSDDYDLNIASCVVSGVYGVNDNSLQVGTDLFYEEVSGSDYELKLTVYAKNTDVDVYLKLNMDIPSSASGEVKATITALSGQFVGGELTIAKLSDGEVALSVPDVKEITESGSDAGAIIINMKENTAGALKEDPESLRFTLPKGFTWVSFAGGKVYDITYGEDLTGKVYYEVDGRDLYVRCHDTDGATSTTGKKLMRLRATIDVDSTEAKLGDVKVTVRGKSTFSPSSLVVAKYVDYGVTVEAKNATEVLAGRLAEEVGDIVIDEAAGNSLVDGRTVILTLPDKAKFVEDSYTFDTEGGVDVEGVTLNSDRDQLKFKIDNTGNDAGKITIKDIEVDLAVDMAPGDLVVTVSGSAGVSGDVVVAKVLAPITVTGSENEVKIGIKDQPAGDITIVEAKAEALMDGGRLELTAPSGVAWSKVPTVTVTAGDVELGSITRTTSNRVLVIPIKAESSEAATIKISNITFTVDRTVPVGTLVVSAGGTAVNEDLMENGADNLVFEDAEYVAKFVAAVVVTPAPGETTGTAVFTIGSTTYTLNGEAVTMDVAPYIKDGRTFLPVRFVANAVGVSDNNIIWDAVSKTVTIIKGDRVVQMTIGSKTMLLNGAAIMMDAAPEITGGRTMLPIRFVAQAFGADIAWDAATQTVTVTF